MLSDIKIAKPIDLAKQRGGLIIKGVLAEKSSLMPKLGSYNHRRTI